jgi:anti-sigma regulatory factor (Ser/Thr protein kinase)
LGQERHFEPLALSVPAARQFVRWVIGADHPAGDDVSLLVSELATNAVMHAGTAFSIRVDVDPGNGALRVDVADLTGTGPVEVDARMTADHGRGLSLVAALSKRWV